MHKYFSVVSDYISKHQPKQFKKLVNYIKRDKTNALRLGLLGVFLVFIVALFIYDSTPHYTYEPTKACDILTPQKAMNVLGDKVINHEANKPAFDEKTETAISKCSYSDENRGNMHTIALVIRSGTKDAGVQRNITEFATMQSQDDTKPVEGIGDKAFYDETKGQLSVLDGKTWILLKSTFGESEKTASLQEAVDVAKKILGSSNTQKS